MAEFLKLPELPQRDCVPEVNVETGRVDAILNAEGLPGLAAAFELLLEFVAGFDLGGPAQEKGELLVNRGKGHC